MPQNLRIFFQDLSKVQAIHTKEIIQFQRKQFEELLKFMEHREKLFNQVIGLCICPK